MEICPQEAKTFDSDLEYVKNMLRKKENVVVSLDPSYRGLLDYEDPGQIVDALMKLGFSQVRETAEGGAFVTREYVRLMQEGKMKNIISTSCPAIIYMVEKHYPMLIPYLAPVVSPMVAHGRLIKEKMGDSIKVVFIGPCVAKKMEAEADKRTKGCVDAVIEFNELEQWLEDEGIDLKQCESKPFANQDPMVNQLYPVTNGIVRAVNVAGAPGTYKKLTVSSIKSSREFLHSMKRGYIENCFVELNLCAGGCVNGPGVDKRRGFRFKATMAIENNALLANPPVYDTMNAESLKRSYEPRQVLDKMPTEEEIQQIMKTIGKSGSNTEFNCGACGYMSCREKAIAIYQGKAEASMCLIRSYENARSQANVVLESTPNIIFIFDKDYRIKEFNRRAQEVFHTTRMEALRMYLFDFVDPADFEEVYHSHESKIRMKRKWDHYNMTVLETIVYIPNSDRVLAIIEDVTEEELRVERQLEKKMDMVKLAQSVIDKQMTTAQEIAGLLGETTAETKAILTKLRDAILEDEVK
jgi:iron only hydrogenase large subunit-like protein